MPKGGNFNIIYKFTYKTNLPAVNKRKIFNDPIYGFVTIPDDLSFDIIEHWYFQRLRRIKQLALTCYVYPSALHTRFQHAIGAMFLMTQAIDVLRSKGQDITPGEEQGALLAILLHDIGHGPFSHTLEHSIVPDLTHEELSILFMQRLNNEYKGRLDTAIQIFSDTYPKKFLHQLIAGQLDMDRLDYLKRDSFFSGVSEGVINSDRIIAMLNVRDDQLVVEAKGIYSIEKFIVARRLMYWQVYYHKTVLAAELMLIKILQRAKYLAGKGMPLFCTPALHYFLYEQPGKKEFRDDPAVLDLFSELDDYDIFSAVKVWVSSEDRILSILSKNLVDRHLNRVEIVNDPIRAEEVERVTEQTAILLNLSGDEAKCFISTGIIENNAYNPDKDKINMLLKNDEVVEIAQASDQLNISMLSGTVSKYYFSFPKEVRGR